MLDPSPEQLLSEFEELLRLLPDQNTLEQPIPESISWLGRASALIEMWSPAKGINFQLALSQFQSPTAKTSYEGYQRILVLVYQARHDLLLQTGKSGGIVVASDKPHNFFDGVRKVVETAISDLFVVDPYLNADFVSDYLPFLKSGVSVRLLASKYVDQLVPAANKFTTQSGVTIEVRTEKGMHDRYMFIDNRQGYISSASFKDGGKNAPAQFTELHDAFPQILSIYSELWEKAK